MDWVIQYDPPRSIRQFIKRRGAIQGQSIAFVQPRESAFVDQLKAADIEVKEFDFPKKKLINVQIQIEKLVSKNFGLHQLAKDGFRLVLYALAHSLPSCEVYMMRNWSVLLIAVKTPRVMKSSPLNLYSPLI